MTPIAVDWNFIGSNADSDYMREVHILCRKHQLTTIIDYLIRDKFYIAVLEKGPCHMRFLIACKEIDPDNRPPHKEFF